MRTRQELMKTRQELTKTRQELRTLTILDRNMQKLVKGTNKDRTENQDFHTNRTNDGMWNRWPDTDKCRLGVIGWERHWGQGRTNEHDAGQLLGGAHEHMRKEQTKKTQQPKPTKNSRQPKKSHITNELNQMTQRTKQQVFHNKTTKSPITMSPWQFSANYSNHYHLIQPFSTNFS